MLANDTDPDGYTLVAGNVSNPSNGTLQVFGSDGLFRYQPNEDFVGTDSFNYVVNDGQDVSNVATVTITVRAGCNGKQATITGTSAANKLTGTAGADVIAGLGGNDTIRGKGGKDILCGAKGKDKLIGGKGKDKLIGGKGRDVLRGGPGRDKLKGGPGRDRQIQ